VSIDELIASFISLYVVEFDHCNFLLQNDENSAVGSKRWATSVLYESYLISQLFQVFYISFNKYRHNQLIDA